MVAGRPFSVGQLSPALASPRQPSPTLVSRPCQHDLTDALTNPPHQLHISRLWTTKWTFEQHLTLGAILAATDPVAVVGALHELGAPKPLR